MNGNDLLSRLAALDAAPRTEPTTAEIDREETLLRAVLADTGRPGSAGAVFRRPIVRRVGLTLAGALALGTAVVAVAGGLPGFGGSGPLSSSELASWTGTPKELDTAAAKGSAAGRQCLDLTEDMGTGSPEVSNADIRGNVASMVVTRGSDAVYCLAGSDGSGVAMAISPVEALPADGITLDTYGARGSDDQEFNYVVGVVGPDVQEVVVHDHGKTARATVDNGRMTAWWPDGRPDGLLTGTFTVTFTDGTSHTVPADSLTDHATATPGPVN
ncbi:hypothetical protein [Streptomyces griseoruber]|uniref:Uncharacterized protein n=1 Tax=Streptomyces griseoruber TaxID=1943 RepID=A0A124I105_9ACTN|nr:hypothetical protein [Streptomyces griseoruber]KUN75926.1 hypothetical protein AQJ64_40335 [Streptomyces griseoruber]